MADVNDSSLSDMSPTQQHSAQMMSCVKAHLPIADTMFTLLGFSPPNPPTPALALQNKTKNPKHEKNQRKLLRINSYWGSDQFISD